MTNINILGGQSPISLKIVKDNTKQGDGQRQEKHILEFKKKEVSGTQGQNPGDPEKHLRPSRLVKKLVASENSWEPSYGEVTIQQRFINQSVEHIF